MMRRKFVHKGSEGGEDGNGDDEEAGEVGVGGMVPGCITKDDPQTARNTPSDANLTQIKKAHSGSPLTFPYVLQVDFPTITSGPCLLFLYLF